MWTKGSVTIWKIKCWYLEKKIQRKYSTSNQLFLKQPCGCVLFFMMRRKDMHGDTWLNRPRFCYRHLWPVCTLQALITSKIIDNTYNRDKLKYRCQNLCTFLFRLKHIRLQPGIHHDWFSDVKSHHSTWAEAKIPILLLETGLGAQSWKLFKHICQIISVQECV